MPSRYKTWQLLVVLLLAVTIPMATILGFAQEKSNDSVNVSTAETCRGSHTIKDFYKNVRQLPPANVLEIVDYRLNYATASEGIDLGSLQIEPDWTSLPKDFGPKKHTGCYGILYCEKHLVALQINELDTKFCQLNKH